MASAEKRPLKVFLCHASGDKPPVRDLYKRLTSEGVDAWLDQEKLLPGQDWRMEIPRAVREADVVVICLSKKSITKEGYVQKEIKFALDIAEEKPEGTIFLIPARLEDCVVPERLNRWQWVDLYDDNGFIKLLRSLKLRADAVDASVEPSSYVDSAKETDRKLEQWYTEGLAAFYTEDWDKACQRFQSILSERPNHKNAAEKLEEAERQRNLSKLYEQATGAVRSEDWGVAIQILDELSKKSADYKDSAQLLRNARKQKQLKELYAEAKALHSAQKWEAVVKVFEQILSIDPNHPDSDALLPPAQKEVAELQRLAELNGQYSHALREMDSRNWYEARRLLESVHKSQTGFLETEKLLKKVENEIVKEEEKRKQNDQVNTLYEQAHGLLRSKKWRNALDKMVEIRKLDDGFPDTDGIAEKAQKELAREEKEAERQNKLAALYAEAVKLLKEEKYQQALDKWGEVKAVDPKYPDRQRVGMTAKKELVKQTKPVQVKRRVLISRQYWMGIVGLIVVGAVITGVVLSGRRNQGVLPVPIQKPMQTSAIRPINPTATRVPNKTNTPRPAVSVPATSVPVGSGHSVPTMVDEFDNARFDGTYDTTKWDKANLAVGSKISQEDGLLVVQQSGPDKGLGLGALSLNTGSPLPKNKYSYLEIKMMVTNAGYKGEFTIQFWTDKTFFGCGFNGNYGSLKKYCWREDMGGGNAKWLFGYSGSTDKWYIFTIRVDPFEKIINFYFDGQNVASYPLADRETLPTGFGLGCWVAQDNNFQGYIDYVKLYTSNE